MRVRLRFLILGVLTVLLAGSSLLSAQPAPTVEQRVVPLTVLDRDGQPIDGLTADQIRIRGLKADWTLTPDKGPRRILLVADARRHPSDTERWRTAKKFLAEFLRVATADVELALHLLPSETDTEPSFTTDREPLWSHIVSLPDEGIAADTVPVRKPQKDTIFSTAGTYLRPGDALLLVAGCLFFDRDTSKTISGQLGSKGVRLFHFNAASPVLLPGGGAFSTNLPVRFEWVVCPTGTLNNIIKETGGAGFDMLSPPAYADPGPGPNFMFPENFFETVAQRVFVQMKHGYKLELQLEEPLVKKSRLRIEITDKALKKQRKPRLFFPRHLYPEATTRE